MLRAHFVKANKQYWSTSKHKPKHKLEKWFIIFVDGVGTYVQNTSIKELNHFSS